MPPWYQVDHLHMHVIMEPIQDTYAAEHTFGKQMRKFETQIEMLEKKKYQPPDAEDISPLLVSKPIYESLNQMHRH